MNAAPSTVVQHFLRRHPLETARVLEVAAPAEAARVLDGEPADVTASTFRRMQGDRAARVLVRLKPDSVVNLVGALDLADVARLLARLDEADRTRILGLLDQRRGDEVRALLAYPAGTAGSLMDARVATLRVDATVAMAMARVGELHDRRISDLMLVDHDGMFQGVVRLQDLVGAPPDQRLVELNRPSIHVHPMTPREDVVELLNQHRLSSLPVVDLRGRVAGVIRHVGLVEAAQQDLAANLQAMVGGSTEERALSAPWVGIRGRLPWLNVNLLTAFLAAAVVGLFESTIAQFTALAVLLPVVAGQSGNTGAQALAVTMRGLALREIRTAHAPRVILKEAVVGAVNGLAIGAVTALAVYLWSSSEGLALVMFTSMVFAMVLAAMAGAAIPVLLVKLGRDPATASSIILTTITDVTGFFGFLGLATLLSDML